MHGGLKNALVHMEKCIDFKSNNFTLMELFEALCNICAESDKPVVMMIDSPWNIAADFNVDSKNMPSGAKNMAWTKAGFHEALRIILSEKNTLFESLIAKLTDYPELNLMLRTLLFTGKNITYNTDEPAIDTATMFGFIKNQDGNVLIANRIFETRLYNLYLSTSEMQNQDIYKVRCRTKINSL